MVQVYFLNVNYNTQRTGIENASLLRARVFVNHLNITPVFITSKYNHHLMQRVNDLVSMNLLPKEISFLNPYLSLQKTALGTKQQHYYLNNASWTTEFIQGSKDYRTLDENKELIAYTVFSEDGLLSFRNFFHKRKKIRREFYDHNGYLSKVQQLNAIGEVDVEMYYTIYGSICMYKYFEKIEEKVTLIKLHLLDGFGNVQKIFTSEQQFLDDWLQNTLPNNENTFLFIERGKTFYPLIQKWQNNTRKIISLIHSSHLATGTDYLTGNLNRHYKETFEDLTRVDAVVVLTNRQKEHIEARFSSQPRLFVIPHVYDQAVEIKAYATRKRKKCIYLARLSSEKQHELCIRMFAKVVKQHPDATLHFVGFGSLLNELTASIKEKKLENNIKIEPFTTDVQSIYNEAALSVTTSKVEGFSLFILESLAHGVPVVSFDIDYGPADLIQQGKNGFLIPPFDEDEMAKKLIEILRDDHLLEQLSLEAYQTKERYNGEFLAQKWHDLLLAISTTPLHLPLLHEKAVHATSYTRQLDSLKNELQTLSKKIDALIVTSNDQEQSSI